MRHLPVSLIAMVVAMTMAVAPAASAADEALEGIPKVQLVFDGVDADAVACGITEAGLETTVRFVLGQMGPKLVSSSKGSVPWLYVNVNAIDDNTHCFYSLLLELNAIAHAGHTQALLIGRIWREGFVGLRAKSGVADAVSAALEERVKRFAIAWKERN